MANRKHQRAGALLMAMAMAAGASTVPALAAEEAQAPPQEDLVVTPEDPAEPMDPGYLLTPEEEFGGVAPQAAVTADQIVAKITKNYSAPICLMAGGQTAYTLSVKNKGTEAAALQLTLTFGTGVAQAAPNTSSYISTVTPFDPETGTLVLRLTVPRGRTITPRITVTAGEEGTLSMTARAVLEESGEEVPVTGAAAELPISRYATLKDLRVAGGNLGYYHAAGVERPSFTVIDSRRVPGSCLDALEGAVFSFEDAFVGCKLATHTDARGQVTNADSGRTWQCVGFVPYAGSSDQGDNRETVTELERFVFAEDGKEGFGVTGKTLPEAQEYVRQQGGVLYGAAAGPESLQALARAAEQGNGTANIMTVWYLPKARDYRGSYDDAAFPSRTAVDYRENSPGVTVRAGEVTQTKEGGSCFFDHEILVTLGENLPDRVNVNLTQALGEAMVKSNETFRRNVPGDTMRFRLRLEDRSGTEYRYTPNSAAIGTVPSAQEGEPTLGTGFEGYPIGAGGQFCPIPRRLWNSALRALGAREDALDDASVGALLRSRGYGEADQSDGAVTQSALGQYYLDWFNNKRPEGQEVTGFAQLTGEELALLTSGPNGSYVPEDCADVAGAFYGLFYRDIYTFDGRGLYDRMAENGGAGSYAETLARSLLQPEADSGGEAVISTHIDGPLTGNGFQMTRMGFGMQFGLSRIYQVTYDYNRGTPEEDRLLDGKYPSGDPVAVRPDPVWEGHSFQGWLVTTDDPAVEAPAVSQGTEQFTMPAANVHLVAQWRTPDPKPEPKPEPKPDPKPDPDPDPKPDPKPDPGPDEPSTPEPTPPEPEEPDLPVPEQPARPSAPPTDIPREEPPSEPAPAPEPPPEPEPNTPQVPKTGDPTALWAALSGLSSAGLGLLAWWRRK